MFFRIWNESLILSIDSFLEDPFQNVRTWIWKLKKDWQIFANRKFYWRRAAFIHGRNTLKSSNWKRKYVFEPKWAFNRWEKMQWEITRWPLVTLNHRASYASVPLLFNNCIIFNNRIIMRYALCIFWSLQAFLLLLNGCLEKKNTKTVKWTRWNWFEWISIFVLGPVNGTDGRFTARAFVFAKAAWLTQ